MPDSHYEERFFAFIDILGFKAKINKTITDAEYENEVYECMKYLENFRKRECEDFGEPSGYQVSSFSDSIAISYANNFAGGLFNLLFSLLYLSIDLAGHGFFLRGAVTYGKIYHKDRICYGPAMVRAYELESQISKYPRIIIDREVLESCLNNEESRRHSSEEERRYIEDLIQIDWDYPYIDFLSGSTGTFEWACEQYDWCQKVREFINEGLNSKEENVYSKFLWLKNKYNIFVNDKTKILSSGIETVPEYEQYVEEFKKFSIK